MLRTARLFLTLSAAVLMTDGQGIVHEMTPEAIAEAKTIPKGGVEVRYVLAGGTRTVGIYTTPFMRVRMAAAVAKREYRPIEESVLTPEVLAPELQIIANASVDGAETASVVTIVITPKKGTPEEKAARAIRPIRIDRISTVLKNVFGAEFTGDGMIAAFPLDALNDDQEIHVVYDRPIIFTRAGPSLDPRYCTDCRAPLSLKGLR